MYLGEGDGWSWPWRGGGGGVQGGVVVSGGGGVSRGWCPGVVVVSRVVQGGRGWWCLGVVVVSRGRHPLPLTRPPLGRPPPPNQATSPWPDHLPHDHVIYSMMHLVSPPPWLGQTDACENITFARFATRAVIISVFLINKVDYSQSLWRVSS